jgi:hypothetical protein
LRGFDTSAATTPWAYQEKKAVVPTIFASCTLSVRSRVLTLESPAERCPAAIAALGSRNCESLRGAAGSETSYSVGAPPPSSCVSISNPLRPSQAEWELSAAGVRPR